MADTIKTVKHQSKAEIRQWDVDFTADLTEGVTVASATAVHIPPSGIASTPVVGSILDNVVPVKLGPLTVEGVHILIITATLSDAEKSEARLLIPVDY
jgi:hypothetical protein